MPGIIDSIRAEDGPPYPIPMLNFMLEVWLTDTGGDAAYVFNNREELLGDREDDGTPIPYVLSSDEIVDLQNVKFRYDEKVTALEKAFYLRQVQIFFVVAQMRYRDTAGTWRIPEAKLRAYLDIPEPPTVLS